MQTGAGEFLPVCGRGHSYMQKESSGMRLEETDEMLRIFEAETIADHCDGQCLIIKKLYVLLALAQWWKFYAEHGKSEIKVFAIGVLEYFEKGIRPK